MSAGKAKGPKVTTVGPQQHIKLGEAQALIDYKMGVERRSVYAVLRLVVVLSVSAVVLGAVALGMAWR